MPKQSRSFSRAIRSTRPTSSGFHGHTILHRPAERRTWQIGDGALLARRLGDRCRRRFPLRPMSPPAARARRWRRSITPRSPPALPKPLAVLNLGGVANVTWIGSGGSADGGRHPRLRHRPRQCADRRLGAAPYRRGSRSRRRAGRRRTRPRRRMSRAFSQRPFSPASRRNRSTATIFATPCPRVFRWQTAPPP